MLFRSEFITDKSQTYSYQSQGKNITEPQIDMFERVEFSLNEWKQIFEYCKEIEIEAFTTPQNPSDLDLILSITDLPKLKVGSDDLTNLPLLKYYASKNIPMIISTGMSYEDEIRDAIETILNEGCKDLTVLHCVSLYPTPLEKVNINKMVSIKEKFNVKVGYSDHTEGWEACKAATLAGATILEKHFTLDKNLPGPDHRFSADINELKQLVVKIRQAEILLGSHILEPDIEEIEMRKIARRNITAIKEIKENEIFTLDNLGLRRPGDGIPPKFLYNILGKKAKKYISSNTLINENDFENI